VDEGSTSRAGLYVHVPFCRHVCPYCDYAVLIAGSPRREAYVRAIGREVERYSDQGWAFDTVYLGGGTPSSLEIEQLAEVLDLLRAAFDLGRDPQVFVEANPEDVSTESVRGWLDLGVDTVSLGVQSLSDEVLDRLGRHHGANQAAAATRTLVEAGFGTVSVDLIYGFEGHDEAEWTSQLQRAVALGPDHLSCYQLTIHRRTVFGRRLARGELSELDGDLQAGLFLRTHEVLADAGFDAYEVSNFAAGSRHRSRHNMKYWRHQPYLGLGPSAHSFRGDRRWWNRRKLRQWDNDLARGLVPVEGDETLTPGDLALEALALGLRSSDGVDLDELRRRWGLDVEAANGELIDDCETAGYLRREGGRLVPTVLGLAVADGLATRFDLPGNGG
jgi:oxygen-independent coproporphyrinogen-3 oxidase